MAARVEIDLSALVANWRMLAGRAAPAYAAAVVKADAYGLGADQVSRALARSGCRRFYVATLEEGVALRASLGSGPEVAVFHGPPPGAVPDFVVHQLEPVLNSLEQIELWIDSGGAPHPASLHLDTGMNRLGVGSAQWVEAARLQPQPTHLISHLACADEPDHPMNNRQLAEFRQAVSHWPNARLSLAATAGAYLGADFAFDEIRPGIGLYGGGPTPREGKGPRPVVRVTAPILQLRTVTRGETVGYGASWTSDGDRTLATVAIGYADGFLRSASNRGYGVVHGERRPILGRVSMDLMMLDVTGLPAAIGDPVELIGPALPIGDQADAMCTIDYELLTRLGPRLPRIYAGAE
ncbi:MAG: alanine racemase [Alphaproteobacteria bacterium]|nr:alanine racemase [Alphaproteobacteria bacterium]